MTVRIIVADVLEGLSQLQDESVHCVVTSPPYWGLRDYGITGQLGLEPTLGEHIDKMVAVFREVRRVLRRDGTLWLNYGDCYVSAPPGNKVPTGLNQTGGKRNNQDPRKWNTDKTKGDGLYGRRMALQLGHGEDKDAIWGNKNRQLSLKPKDLCGVPWRVAFALQADGWWLRQDIIWSKPNPMPESIKDRCTKAHEYLFLLAKAERYYFDAEAIAEPISDASILRLSQPNLPNQHGSDRAHAGMKPNGPMKACGKMMSFGRPSREARALGKPPVGNEAGGLIPYPESRNKRSVWEVATHSYAEAHFATFPPALIEPCIKAGCPEGGMVLDPFGGSGTTGLVADRLKRSAILIELNPEYAAMAERRIKGDAPLFAEVCA